MRLPDRTAKAVLALGDGHQMDMVGHQAISPQLDAAPPAPLAHQIEVGAVVVVGEEGLLAPVSPLSDVVWVAGSHDSCNACHGSQPIAS